MGIMNKIASVKIRDLPASQWTKHTLTDDGTGRLYYTRLKAIYKQTFNLVLECDGFVHRNPPGNRWETVPVNSIFVISEGYLVATVPTTVDSVEDFLSIYGDRLATIELANSVEEKIAGPQVKFPDVHVSSYSAAAAPPITLSPGLYRFDWKFTGGTDAGARDYILPIYMDGEVDYANAVIGPSYGQVRRAFTVKNKPLRWFYFYGGTGNTSADYTDIVLTMIEQTEEII